MECSFWSLFDSVDGSFDDACQWGWKAVDEAVKLARGADDRLCFVACNGLCQLFLKRLYLLIELMVLLGILLDECLVRLFKVAEGDCFQVFIQPVDIKVAHE